MGDTHPNMATKGTVTIRPRKLLTNRLLQRRQMILDVHHPGLATPDKEMLKNMIAEYLSKANAEATVIFGMKTKFGGGRSSCFALVYDSVDSAKKFEPQHRLIRSGHAERPGTVVARKQRKEKKNREKKFRGTRKEKRVRAQKS